MPGLTIKQFASTADVEALMCSASAQQHQASSHLVLSVYVACKDHTTGEHPLPEGWPGAAQANPGVPAGGCFILKCRSALRMCAYLLSEDPLKQLMAAEPPNTW